MGQFWACVRTQSGPPNWAHCSPRPIPSLTINQSSRWGHYYECYWEFKFWKLMITKHHELGKYYLRIFFLSRGRERLFKVLFNGSLLEVRSIHKNIKIFSYNIVEKSCIGWSWHKIWGGGIICLIFLKFSSFIIDKFMISRYFDDILVLLSIFQYHISTFSL